MIDESNSSSSNPEEILLDYTWSEDEGDNTTKIKLVVMVEKGVERKRSTIRSKMMQDPTSNMILRVLTIIALRELNRLKATDEHTIMEECQLSTDRVMSDYSAIWETIKFHKFEHFTKAQTLYIPMWVHVFYEAYAKALPNKRKGVIWRSLEEVHV